MASHADISDLLINWGQGDRTAFDKLLPVIERELHRLAHRYMQRENPNHALQTTALINETYLRLIDQRKIQWQNRAHFFGIAAQIMRRILLNYARDQNRRKRAGREIHVSLSEAMVMPAEKDRELIALNDALTRLEAIDERKSKVVELRYFGGLTVEEVAEVLKISTITVMRDWEFAKAWLSPRNDKWSISNLGQVEEVFHVAMSYDPEERMAYLSRASEDNPVLLHEVESLVAAYESGSGLLDETAVTLALKVIGSRPGYPMAGHETPRMPTTSEGQAFDRGVRPVLEIVLPEKADAVIHFRADPELRARIEELARKSTEGQLTEDERAEYTGYVRANKFVAILKRQAEQLSNSHS